MSSMTVPVCWKAADYKPSSNPKNPYVDFYKGPTDVYTNDVISIGDATTITFTPATNCSGPQVSSFTMKIAPTDDVNRLITTLPATNKPNDLTILAKYDGKSTIHLNMTLVGPGGNPVYTIDGAKPIIRNEPHSPVILQYKSLLIVLALAALAYIVYRSWKAWSTTKEI
ncbi:MAG TPA: hypothetical protein VGO25_07310 [Rhodanobacteraceae bacterium]|jgi:hypothetical protein|nr:hypothetical protein [Rhodanobacteraceae bacterium]